MAKNTASTVVITKLVTDHSDAYQEGSDANEVNYKEFQGKLESEQEARLIKLKALKADEDKDLQGKLAQLYETRGEEIKVITDAYDLAVKTASKTFESIFTETSDEELAGLPLFDDEVDGSSPRKSVAGGPAAVAPSGGSAAGRSAADGSEAGRSAADGTSV